MLAIDALEWADAVAVRQDGYQPNRPAASPAQLGNALP